MEMENKGHCPVLDIDGVISGGKQFDLDITLPEDNRDVIYGDVCHEHDKYSCQWLYNGDCSDFVSGVLLPPCGLHFVDRCAAVCAFSKSSGKT